MSSDEPLHFPQDREGSTALHRLFRLLPFNPEALDVLRVILSPLDSSVLSTEEEKGGGPEVQEAPEGSLAAKAKAAEQKMGQLMGGLSRVIGANSATGGGGGKSDRAGKAGKAVQGAAAVKQGPEDEAEEVMIPGLKPGKVWRLDQVDGDGFTALHAATAAGNSEGALLLLSHQPPLPHVLQRLKLAKEPQGAQGAKASKGSKEAAPSEAELPPTQYPPAELGLQVRSFAGSTALQFAARAGDLRVVRRLVELGTRVNETDRTGAGPLHYAAALEDPGEAVTMVKYLVHQAKADVNLQYTNQKTNRKCLSPLHYVAQSPGGAQDKVRAR